MTRTLLLAALLCPVLAFAQEPPPPEPEWGTTITVEVPRPKVAYILSRQKAEDLELAPLREDFVPKIVRSVDRKPF